MLRETHGTITKATINKQWKKVMHTGMYKIEAKVLSDTK